MKTTIKCAALEPKPAPKEGQYWEFESKYIVRIEAVEDGVAYYTFVSQYAPVGQHMRGFSKDLPDFYTLLTDNEVEEVLIEEAKERGFLCKDWISAKNGCKMFNLGLKDSFKYSPDQDELTNLGGHVYFQGNWGKPINEEEREARYYWNVSKGERKIDAVKGKDLTQQEAERIAEALNYD